jgi:hypothetical protein
MAHPKRLARVPPEQVAAAYREIGRFITSVADLDAIVSTLLGAATQMKGELSDLIVQSIDFNRKREILKSLRLIGANAELYKEIINLVDQADALIKKRHLAAHGLLAPQNGKLIISSLSLPALAKYAAGGALLSVDELPALSDRADEIGHRLLEIAKSVRLETAVEKPSV